MAPLLLTQWHEHLAGRPAADERDRGAPSRAEQRGRRGPGPAGTRRLTLLHYAQVDPLSAPFWHRTGYRPLWTTWEARPAGNVR
jgi:hypothetical protein